VLVVAHQLLNRRVSVGDLGRLLLGFAEVDAASSKIDSNDDVASVEVNNYWKIKLGGVI